MKYFIEFDRQQNITDQIVRSLLSSVAESYDSNMPSMRIFLFLTTCTYLICLFKPNFGADNFFHYRIREIYVFT